jgi:hypothetical protein
MRAPTKVCEGVPITRRAQDTCAILTQLAFGSFVVITSVHGTQGCFTCSIRARALAPYSVSPLTNCLMKFSGIHWFVVSFIPATSAPPRPTLAAPSPLRSAGRCCAPRPVENSTKYPPNFTLFTGASILAGTLGRRAKRALMLETTNHGLQCSFQLCEVDPPIQR